ncbi:MAG: hypothetical protein FJW40_00255 [Acidobacteria bacterium]|nr:hypothetical protein [Acidobacteriota bacterium]
MKPHRTIPAAIPAAAILIAFAAGPSKAQQPDLAAEIRALRASVEKLARSQQELVLLTRVQITEARVAPLEAQRSQLLMQEAQLDRELAAMQGGAGQASSQAAALAGAGQEFVATSPGAPQMTSELSRRLDEVRRVRHGLDQRIQTLRARSAVWERQIEELQK